mgnify:CR=1 FL=1
MLAHNSYPCLSAMQLRSSMPLLASVIVSVDSTVNSIRVHYDALRVSHTMRDGNDTPVPYLEWGVDVVANAAETGDMTIIEHLPQGTELLTGTEAGETNGRAENLAGLVVRLCHCWRPSL